MITTTYSEWHTLTVEFDGEDDDGKPLPLYSLDHPASCRTPESDPDECWLAAEIVAEFADFPHLVGLPTEPGSYRIRAWGTSGDWAGPHYIEPDCGVNIDRTDREDTP
ncbi:hypothetical protein ACWDUL_21075 [Nocardia niigatensis]